MTRQRYLTDLKDIVLTADLSGKGTAAMERHGWIMWYTVDPPVYPWISLEHFSFATRYRSSGR